MKLVTKCYESGRPSPESHSPCGGLACYTQRMAWPCMLSRVTSKYGIRPKGTCSWPFLRNLLYFACLQYCSAATYQVLSCLEARGAPVTAGAWNAWNLLVATLGPDSTKHHRSSPNPRRGTAPRLSRIPLPVLRQFSQ